MAGLLIFSKKRYLSYDIARRKREILNLPYLHFIRGKLAEWIGKFAIRLCGDCAPEIVFIERVNSMVKRLCLDISRERSSLMTLDSMLLYSTLDGWTVSVLKVSH